MSSELVSDETTYLRRLVAEHQVCYEVSPELLMVKGNQLKVGFALSLWGTHDHGKTRLTPGCERCIRTYNDLRKIAEWILPIEERKSWYDVEPFDRSLHQTSTRRFRTEVLVAVKILHRHGFDQPIDQCEEVCLNDMCDRLAELGVPREHWRRG